MASSGERNNEEPKTIGLTTLVDPNNPRLDIVFVHGFTGHPGRTWTREVGRHSNHDIHTDAETLNDNEARADARAFPLGRKRPHGGSSNSATQKFRRLLSSDRRRIYWPRDLLPNTVPDARVLTYGYDSNIRHPLKTAVSQNSVYDISNDLLVSLEAERRKEPTRPLFFIVHSLGGIVVKEALRQSRSSETHQSGVYSLYKSTCGIMFFGTPHGGAEPLPLVRGVAERLARAMGFQFNEHIVQTLAPSSERLRELRDEFIPMARDRDWIIYSFQEQYGVANLQAKIVDDTSSCFNDKTIEVAQHIASDHMGMCRFSGPDDTEYVKVSKALEKVTQRIVQTSKRRSLSPSPTSDPAAHKALVRSLAFNQIDARHATITRAHDRTCQWLLMDEAFQAWLRAEQRPGKPRFFWIKGNPGTGKSTIMKFLLEQSSSAIKDTTIASFFFNARGDSLEKAVLGMYRSLLYQLFTKLPDLQSQLDTFRSPNLQDPASEDSITWSIESVKELFGRTVNALGERRLICFIDALDECSEDQIREMVKTFEQLVEATTSSGISFLICFSSRHYPHVSVDHASELVLEDQEGHTQDLQKFINSRLKIGRSKLATEIKEEVLRKSAGIFLWVVLVVEMLNRAHDRGKVHTLRRLLDTIPARLEDLFLDMFSRDNEDPEELILCLQWILYANQPLRPEELYFAIIAGTTPEELTEWDHDVITEDIIRRFVVNCSKGLAQATKSKTPTVQFIHESVRDFLLNGGFRKLRSELRETSVGIAQEQLKRSCDKYWRAVCAEFFQRCRQSLGACDTTKSPNVFDLATEAHEVQKLLAQKFPFLRHAVTNLLHHAEAAAKDGVSQSLFISKFDRKLWIQTHNTFQKYSTRQHHSTTSLLYILAEQNLPNLIRLELGSVKSIDNKQGGRFASPPHAALKPGLKERPNEDALRALLQPLGCPIAHHNTFIDSILSKTESNFENVISLLLQNRDSLKGSLGDWAIFHGRKDVLKVLQQTGKVKLFTHKNDLTNLLAGGARSGDMSLVETFILDGAIDFDELDESKVTPLICAAANGHDNVVKILLATGRVEHGRSCLGKLPILEAARNGHDAVVKTLTDTYLLSSSVSANSKPDSLRKDFSRALWEAARNGHNAIVKILLETNEVGPTGCFISSGSSMLVPNSTTPLWEAASNGHDDVVKTLLKTGRVDSDGLCSSSELLKNAAGNGHSLMVGALLRSQLVDPDKLYEGFTPLWVAARNGHDDIVNILLSTGRVDPDKPCDLSTPLMQAAENGHNTVVETLLATDRVDVDKAYGGDTAFLRAVAYGRASTVKLLLETDQVDVNQRSSEGETPLMVATSRFYIEVVDALLETGKVEVDARRPSGDTAFLAACEWSSSNVVQLLLERGEPNLDLRGPEENTALHRAALSMTGLAVRALLETGKMDVNARNFEGMTPLMTASRDGNFDAVQALVGRGRADVECRDHEQRTALFWCMCSGQAVQSFGTTLAIAKFLLDVCKADVTAVDSQRYNILQFARLLNVDSDTRSFLEGRMDKS